MCAAGTCKGSRIPWRTRKTEKKHYVEKDNYNKHYMEKDTLCGQRHTITNTIYMQGFSDSVADSQDGREREMETTTPSSEMSEGGSSLWQVCLV